MAHTITMLSECQRNQVRTEAIIFNGLAITFALSSRITKDIADIVNGLTPVSYLTPVFITIYAIAFGMLGTQSLYNYCTTRPKDKKQ